MTTTVATGGTVYRINFRFSFRTGTGLGVWEWTLEMLVSQLELAMLLVTVDSVVTWCGDTLLVWYRDAEWVWYGDVEGVWYEDTWWWEEGVWEPV